MILPDFQNPRAFVKLHSFASDPIVYSKQAADPCGKSRNRREYDEKLKQLTFYIKAVLFWRIDASHFWKIVLEKTKLHKQEIIEADHVVKLVDSKYDHKSYKELPECKTTSEAIPD